MLTKEQQEKLLFLRLGNLRRLKERLGEVIQEQSRLWKEQQSLEDDIYELEGIKFHKEIPYKSDGFYYSSPLHGLTAEVTLRVDGFFNLHWYRFPNIVGFREEVGSKLKISKRWAQKLALAWVCQEN